MSGGSRQMKKLEHTSWQAYLKYWPRNMDQCLLLVRLWTPCRRCLVRPLIRSKMNAVVIDKASQVSFVLESLPESFLQFRSNVVMNKIAYTRTTLLKELHNFESLMKIKGQKGEANVATSTRKFHRGSTFGTKSVPSSSGTKNWKKKKKGGQGNKAKPVAAKMSKKAKVAKGICFHCIQEGRWKRNCPKYVAENKKAKQGKITKRPFTGTGHRAKEPLELVHSDLCGHMNVKARGGFEYFITFTDDCSRYGYAYLMQHKSEALEKFKEYKTEVENALNQPDGIKPIGCKWIYKRKRGADGKIFRDRKNKTLALSQALYIDKIVVKYSIQNSKRGLLPFRHGVTWSKEQCRKTPQVVEEMRHILYASAVGNLMYAMLCTRPDICYVVGIVNRYQFNPGLAHWTVIKTILKYLRRTRDYILIVKQGCIIDSTMETEYVAACEAVKEVVWLRKFLIDLEVVPNISKPITFYCDNSGAVANSREPRSHKCEKHIQCKYHLIREIVHRGDVIVT
ncbi:gag/pol protein [Cucumis melo var. makuwa]|uniref:Gag/pol protein n=1 Tax=Cucumis melo var. makuwa TaxID=1194695 RepID=A0A5D3DJY0_CUCMM|nr:gag/pol protein [Cucumis melo var. makuwa]